MFGQNEQNALNGRAEAPKPKLQAPEKLQGVKLSNHECRSKNEERRSKFFKKSVPIFVFA
jgi:hypothetical protein